MKIMKSELSGIPALGAGLCQPLGGALSDNCLRCRKCSQCLAVALLRPDAKVQTCTACERIKPRGRVRIEGDHLKAPGIPDYAAS